MIRVAAMVKDRAVRYLPSIVGAVLLLLAGWVLAKLLRAATVRALALLDGLFGRRLGPRRAATQEKVLLRLERRPGQYVVAGWPLVRVWPGDRVTESLAVRVNAVFVLGNQRTATQDIEFAIHQLVEIAVRALSPGINDPFTAITCVDRLGSALRRLAHRDLPSRYRFDARIDCGWSRLQ